MPPYEVIAAPGVEKDLRRLTVQVQRRVLQRMEGLRENPLPYGVERLSGSPERYRIRVGDYRIVYAIDNDVRRIIVLRARHRRDVYRSL